MTLAILSVLLVIGLTGTALADPKDHIGDATIISHGQDRQPGVEAEDQAFYRGQRPRHDTASGPSPLPGSAGPASPGSEMVSNRCVGLVSDGEVIAFSSSPDCGSFVPATEPQAPERPTTPRRRQPSPEEVALSLRDRAIALAPDPQLRLAPALIGLTGLDSFFWLANEPSPIVAAAGVGGLTVTAEARPVQYVWDFGDGARKTTSHPGSSWTRRRRGNIRHLYETRGRYEVAVDVIWEARWRLGAGAWRHLGYFSTGDSVDYPVRQVVALLVPPR